MGAQHALFIELGQSRLGVTDGRGLVESHDGRYGEIVEQCGGWSR